MITLNNSNIDFDLDKKILAREYSILLQETSCNLIFRTYGEDRMTIMSSGNIGVGLANPTAPLEVSGNIKATGAIISTGSGFQGKGVYLTEIPITGVLNLLPTLQGLSGNVGSVEINIESTSNNLVNRILEETTYGSNYTLRSNRELNTRIDNTSNYVFSASNFLVNRIVLEIGQTSNYILTASNNLVRRVVEETGFGSNYLMRMDTNASNYILTASNNLVNRVILETGFGSNYLLRMDTNASNYILTASNNLVNRVILETGFGSNYLQRMDTNASNYILTASNNLVRRVLEETGFGSNYLQRMDTNASNYILTTSNNLVNRVMLETGFGSNYLVRMDTNASNYILTASNNLVRRVVEETGFGSNYLVRMDTNASNYILTASNNLVNRVVLETGFGSNYLQRMDTNASNYILTASNNLVNRVILETGFGSNYLLRMDTNASNYILTASNNLVKRVVEETGFGSNYLVRMDTNASNYILTTSNNLVRRVIEETGFGSNYLLRMDTNASNYILTASNNLVKRVVEETGFGSNYARDRVGVWNSNYTDLASRWTSNYVDKLNAIAIVSSQWTTNVMPQAASIYYNAGTVGIGTGTPKANLHIYSSNNSTNSGLANTKLVLQEANNSNVFSTIATDILSVPYVAPQAISGSIDKYVVFTYTADNTGEGQTAYSITLPENYSYDVLMVGGGGGGAGNIGGGGGGGAVLYCSNIRIPAGDYNIKVGNGGNGTGQNGFNTEAFNALCIGGGGAANIIDSSVSGAANGNYGGSGAGGKSVSSGFAGAGGFGDGGVSGLPSMNAPLLNPAFRFGNSGGGGVVSSGGILSGGGGGAAGGADGSGKAGKVAGSYITGDGNGGSGVQLNIIKKDISGSNISALFWGAGGGGGAFNITGAGFGGRGGGGAGIRSGAGTVTALAGGDAYSTASGMNAAFGSGSGGGGGSATLQSNGGNGGAGIIIIRYRPLMNISGTPEMQLVIGDTIEAGGSNYKIGNYNGNFKIKTSTSNIDTSTFIMESMGNVGIGTSVITSKLHLYDSRQNAILTLQDNTSIATLIPPADIYASAIDFGVIPPTALALGLYEKILVFTYSADSSGTVGQSQLFFTTNEDINADILVVGGGGAGGCFGGGGGAGQVLLTTNFNILANTSVVVNVGKGGVGGGLAGINGQGGYDSSIMIGGTSYIAKGGGGGGARNGTTLATVAGGGGGSGGGSSSGNAAPASLGGVSTKTGYLNWKSFGNNGGIGSYKPVVNPDHHFAGGGGGAGYVGGTGVYAGTLSGATIGAAGSGGNGVDLSSIFGVSVGMMGMFGGGGGGMMVGYGALASGGAGGGGNGGGTGGASSSAINNTGGGGGGGSSVGGNGGTGVVIIRYRQKNIEGNSEIQLLKGSDIGAGKTNYKIGNYDGDYKVKSSSYNNDVDRLVIQAKGNTVFNNTSGMAVATIFNNGDFRTSGSQISDSDNRIKKDVADIDDVGALRMIMAVEPKTYRYIDDERGRNGSEANCDASLIYGFIAQQIRDVIPDATELRKNFLPNIMKRAICDNDRVYLDLTGYGDLPVKDTERKINIRFKNGGGYNFSITEVNKEYFVIDNADMLIEEVFVYGYEVNDFHILTKDYIYTLNVSATRELHRKMLEQEKRIKELEDRLRV
jgi:hypothetical protein